MDASMAPAFLLGLLAIFASAAALGNRQDEFVRREAIRRHSHSIASWSSSHASSAAVAEAPRHELEDDEAPSARRASGRAASLWSSWRNSAQQSAEKMITITSTRVPRRSMAEAPGPSQSRGAAAAPAPAPAVTAASSRGKRSRGSKVRRWVLGVALGALVGAIAGILLGGVGRILVILWKRSRKSESAVIFHAKIQPKMLEFLEAPDAFDAFQEIGKGGAGTVYRAIIAPLELPIAIKRIPMTKLYRNSNDKNGENNSKSKSNSNGISGSFGKQHTMAEIETLGKVRHMNLTALYAYVRQPDAHLLLYQFMAKGSLREALRDSILDWPTRRQIAIGMATGLKYLHYDCTPRILHRDLKTANILLDENNEAHLGDFGLAKALPDDMTHVTTGVAGTVGYMATEYQETCKFTTSSDVYSLGIVLAVLISGKEPSDEFFRDMPAGISGWMTFLLQTGQELKAIDPKLLPQESNNNGSTMGNAENEANVVEENAVNGEENAVNGEENAANGEGNADANVPVLDPASAARDVEEMKLAMRIVFLCTKPNPKDRPSSKDVLLMLNPNKLATARPMSELITEY